MHESSLVVTLCGLLAATSWGISNFMGAKASKGLGPIASSFLVNTIGMVVYVLCFVLFFRTNMYMTLSAFLYAATSGIVFAIGALAFFKGLKVGPVSIVAPLSSIYPLATMAVGLIAFHAQLSLYQFGGIALVVVGAMTAVELC